MHQHGSSIGPSTIAQPKRVPHRGHALILFSIDRKGGFAAARHALARIQQPANFQNGRREKHRQSL